LPSLKSLVEKEEKEKIIIIKDEKKVRSEKLAEEFKKCKDKLTDEVRLRFEKFKKKSEEERKKMINSEKASSEELFKKPEAINKMIKNAEENNVLFVNTIVQKETNSSMFD
jgi:DNA uptake protein ComE-like DNA-binding protein